MIMSCILFVVPIGILYKLGSGTISPASIIPWSVNRSKRILSSITKATQTLKPSNCAFTDKDVSS